MVDRNSQLMYSGAGAPNVLQSVSEEDQQSGLFSENNPYGIRKMMPQKPFQKLINAVEPVLKESSVYQLESDLKKELNKSELRLVKYLRQSFWHEYDTSVAQHREMFISRIYIGQCGNYAFKAVLKDPKQFAYILSRPKESSFRLKALVDLGYARLMEVLEMEVTKHNGDPNIQLIKEMREIYKLADNRLNGGVVQKIHQTSLNVNTNKENTTQLQDMSDEEIDKRLMELQKKNKPQIESDVVDAESRPAIEVGETKTS